MKDSMKDFWKWMKTKGYSTDDRILCNEGRYIDSNRQMLLGYMIEYVMSLKDGGWCHVDPRPLYTAKSIDDYYTEIEHLINSLDVVNVVIGRRIIGRRKDEKS